MEINLLVSELRRNLQATTKSKTAVAKLPAKLSDNTSEELESIIALAIKEQVKERGIPYEDISRSEMALKIKSAVAWLRGPQYRSCLLLQGTIGNGKTTLMEAMYQLYRAVDASIVSVQCERLVEYFVMQTSGLTSAYTEYKTASRLCLDELGLEPERCMIYGVEYMPIQSLLTYRYEKQLPTIITANLSDEMIRERYGERISDRFAEMCTILRFKAPSYRQ